MIVIYVSYYDRKLSDFDFARCLNLLPPGLMQKVTRFRKWEDQQASLHGKLLLRKALKDFGLEYNLMNLKYTRHGRPYIEQAPDFSISHSGFIAVCAFSLHSKIGVDVEEIKPVTIDDFKEQFLDEEWNSIIKSGNLNDCFYYYWTAKEAVLKADGRGLFFCLRQVAIKKNTAKLEETIWFTKKIKINDNYILQIASDQEIDSDIKLVQASF